jgi:LacI family xylobiose transport system transcriptional regulator
MLRLADPPTAIFAGNDFEAMGVYEAARRHGLRIPDDLSVVGFDDLPMSAWVAPPLTTVAQPLAQMAALAAQMVLQPAPDETGNRVELATSLVIRSSTAPPRKGIGAT